VSELKKPAATVAEGTTMGDQWIAVPPEAIRETLIDLKEQGYLSYVFMTCVDHLATPLVEPPPERYELVYQLRNMETGHELRVRVYLPESDPRAQSVHDIYRPANWDERETYDLFGIVFEGHPGLTRILMPEDWLGHPLRRDFPVGGEAVEFSEDYEAWQTAPPEA
jgi:NADH-quinone oxidoreductase subunit C